MKTLTKKHTYWIAFGCFMIALALRLYGITDVSLHPDERHWASRSHQIVKELKSGHYSHLTSHIGHPGVPPAFIMAAGQMIGDSYNSIRGLKVGEPGFVYHVYASRAANAFFSSLLIPCVFLGALLFLGPGVSLFAALALAFDPHHIAVSWMAHLDGDLVLFVFLSVLFYVHAEKRKSLGLKLLAGVFWGLSIVTKPTALSVVGILIVYKIVRSLVYARLKKTSLGLFSWGDVWALVVGKLVFIVLFTRMWHPSVYLRRLKIQSNFADALYGLGVALQSQIFMLLILLAVVIFAGSYLHKSCSKPSLGISPRQRWSYHLAQGSLLLSAFGLLLGLCPFVGDNVPRFWLWVAGLSGLKHKAYGVVWSAPPGGYVGILGSMLSDLVLLGSVFALCGFAVFLYRVFSSRETKCIQVEDVCQKLPFVALLLLSVFIWVLPLTTSDKETIRYAAPVLPFLFLFASWGYSLFIEASASLFKLSIRSSRAAALSLALMAFVLQFFVCQSYWPNYQLYFNSISGGLSAAQERGFSVPGVGYNEAVDFLHKQSVKEEKKLYVNILGDVELLKYTYRLRYPDEERLIFRHSKAFFSDDFLVVFPSFYKLYQRKLELQLAGYKKIFSYKQKGIELLPVYELPTLKLKKPLLADLSLFGRHTGKKRKLFDGTVLTVAAQPQKHSKGFLLFGVYLKLHSGSYQVSYPVTIPEDAFLSPELTPERYVVRLELGSKCERVVTLKELRLGELRDISFECAFAEDSRTQFRAYWFGNVPVAVGSPRIRKLSVTE